MQMKQELEDKLLAKYPEFFDYLGPDQKINAELSELLNQKSIVMPIQFGFECGNGWFVILDTLMESIQNHLKNANRNRKNEFKYKWMWSLQSYLRRKYYKNKTLHKLSEWIYEKAPRKKQPPLIVHITQIKEKMGDLRFYYDGGDKVIEGMVDLAESLSYRTCESCGTTKNVGKTQGWIYTCCKECYDKNDRAQNMKWQPIESLNEDGLF